ncbi:hypothetical protein T439DRAFT_335963 [Meredithblackwellia eburnea MCA 4105]
MSQRLTLTPFFIFPKTLNCHKPSTLSKQLTALRSNVRPTLYTTKAWLDETSLFVEAWGRVCSNWRRWWWSEQLCAWTAGPLTVLLSREGRLGKVKHAWAYMLLGQVVAISFAQALFLSAWSSTTPPHVAGGNKLPGKPKGRLSERYQLPPSTNKVIDRPSHLLVISTLLSLVTVYLVPSTISTPSFLPNLLFMHIFLILPLLPSKTLYTPSSLSFQSLYCLLALVGTGLRIPTYAQLLSPLSSLSGNTIALFVKREYQTLFEHPAESSIGFDVVWTTVSFLVWMVLEFAKRRGGEKGWKGWLVMMGLVLLTPVAGVAVTGAAFLGWKESWLVEVGGAGKQETAVIEREKTS